jgi:hypothetical protein
MTNDEDDFPISYVVYVLAVLAAMGVLMIGVLVIWLR